MRIKNHFELSPPYGAPSARFALRDKSLYVSVHPRPIVQRLENVSDFLMILVMDVLVRVDRYSLAHSFGNDYPRMSSSKVIQYPKEISWVSWNILNELSFGWPTCVFF
jgi:hypothetical protein